MKTIIIAIVLFSVSQLGFSNEAYQKAMSQSIEKMYKASTVAQYLEMANEFERIAGTEKTEWLPLYYGTFAYIMISFQETENAKKDNYLNHAQKLLDKALLIAPRESELYMLQGFLYPSRISIDPMTRGPLYMVKMNAALDMALELNPDNPRVYYLRATMTFHMPEAFGGGAANALPMYKTADEKFKIFKPKNALSPNWGKESNDTEYKKALELVKK